MRNQKPAAPDPRRGSALQTRRHPLPHKRGFAFRSMVAGGLALLLGLSGASVAQAVDGGGGGGAGGGPGGTVGNFQTYSMFFDSFSGTTPVQGYMEASKQWFYDNSGAPASGFSPNAREFMDQACAAALANADARRPAGTPGGRSRVVGMTWASDKSQVWGYGLVNRDALKSLYDQWAGMGRPNVLSGMPDQAAYNGWFDAAFMEGYNSIGAWPNPASAICIALNDSQPPRTYDLSVSTDHSSTFTMAGSKSAVSDMIHLSANGSTIRENVNVNVTLHWGGVESNPRSVTKTTSAANQGSTRSQNFTPADFGWDSWPSGKFWFDISVAKQGSMSAAASHAGQNDSRENWTANPTPPTKRLTSGSPADPLQDHEVLASGMSYNAEISAAANGYRTMTITDTIKTDKVFIGGRDSDVSSQVFMLAPDGTRVASPTIKIDRSTSGQVRVSGTVTGIPNAFQSREYRLIVPTYMRPTKSDYSIPDDSRVCYTAAETNCLNGNSKVTRKVTPAPDKVWVLDENGALTTADPDHTNQAGADGKVFLQGEAITAVVNGRVPANLAENFSSYQIVDTWTKASRYVDFTDVSKARVFYETSPGSGKFVNVTNQFDVTVNGSVTTATAKAAFLNATKGQSGDRVVKLVLNGQFRTDYDTEGMPEVLHNDGHEVWNNERIDTNTPPIYTVTADPDKVWVLDEDGGLSTADPDKTNQAGADGKVFLMNDEVSAVVNGFVPANLARKMTNYQLTDIWDKAAQYVDFSDASKANVYADGVRVTHMFDIRVEGTRTIATAKPEFLDTTAGLSANRKMKLIISGAFRDDYDTDGEVVVLHNEGLETWNDNEVPTNTPPVFTWTPDPNKQVLGSNEEVGDNTYSNVNGLNAWPGQKLEYSIGLDLRVPSGTARGVKSLVVLDVYDPNFIPDKSSVEFWDGRDPKNPGVVPAKNYKLVFDEDKHMFTVTFTDEWIANNVETDAANVNSEWLKKGWLTMRFTGTVAKTTPGGTVVQNQAFQIINDASTATEVPEVNIPTVEPDKESLSTELVDIDGKVLLRGDHVLYRITLDGGPSKDKLAYFVHKFGIVDDYDDEYLDLNAEGVRVVEQETGVDVTDRFNVQVKDGKALVFAKTIDTEGPFGGTIAGDPQPEDLDEFDKRPIRPTKDPIIDQDLLGKKYSVLLDAVVKKEVDGYVIENQATQNIQNTYHQTRIVSNPLKAINPDKDVVVSEETKDDSKHESEVKLYSDFNYRLNSSEIPGNRAYAASQLSLRDAFDRTHDQYTGIWAIYANTDVYDGDELVLKKGALLEDSAGHQSVPATGLFDVVFDEESYTLSVTATQKYLDLINGRMDLPAAFSVYTKMIRIAPGEKIENRVFETYNEVERESNVVWTFTPEHPELAVVKYTLAEGIEKGDRDTAAAAYGISEEELVVLDEKAKPKDGSRDVPGKQRGVEVGIRVSNVGDVPLKNVKITDVTHDGMQGALEDIMCLVPAPAKGEVAVNVGEEPVLSEEGEAQLEAGADTEVEPEVVPGEEPEAGPEEGAAEELETDVEEKPEDARVWVIPSMVTELAIGESVDCVGVLRGMTKDGVHGDTVVATGESVFTDTLVKAEDPWFAAAPKSPAPKGAVTGDPISETGSNQWLFAAAALLLFAAAGSAVLARRRDGHEVSAR